jgi:hypothetical protein
MTSKFKMLIIALISLFIFIGNVYAECGGCGQRPCNYCIQFVNGNWGWVVCGEDSYNTATEEPEWCILSIQECYPSQEEAEERIQELDFEQYQIATETCGGCGQRKCVWTFINGGWIWS